MIDQGRLKVVRAIRHKLDGITEHLAKIKEERAKLFEKLVLSHRQKDGLAAHHKVVSGILIDASQEHISRIMGELLNVISSKLEAR